MLYGFALTCMVKSKSSVLSIHIFCIHEIPLVKIFETLFPPAIVIVWLKPPLPLVSIGSNGQNFSQKCRILTI